MWWTVLGAISVLADGAVAMAISGKVCSDSTTFTSCIKMRSLVLLNGLTLKETPIHLFGDGLTLVKNSDERNDLGIYPVTVDELESSLPKDENSKEAVLDELVTSSLSRFAKSRALQIRLPDLAFWSWNTPEEGRKKKGGGGGVAAAFLSVGGMMGAMWLGAIALMAGKALTVSMMALMLALLASLKKGGGGGEHSTSYEVISVPTGHGHHSHHGRSLVEGVQLAYRGHNATKDYT